MKGFTINGNTADVVKYNENALLPKLPAQVYTLSQDLLGNFFLNITKANFEITTTYGSIQERANHVLNTFNKRSTSTGVLLTGDKGSGKTLLAKLISNQAIVAGLPVILINQPFRGDGFNTYMDDLGECVVLFDEFAKVYSSLSDSNNINSNNENTQQSLLTFFDGTMSAKRLYLVTENKEATLNEFLLKRPGRIFYHYRYGKLSETVIKEVCSHTLNDQTHTDGIIEISRSTVEFSFDMLNAIIEECNMYPNQNVNAITEHLNIAHRNSIFEEFHIKKIELNGKEVNVPLKYCVVSGYHDEVRYELPLQPGKTTPDLGYFTLYQQDVIYQKNNNVIVQSHQIRVYFEIVEKPIKKSIL